MLPYGVDTPLQSNFPLSEQPSILFVGTWEGRKRGRFLRDLFSRVIRPAIPNAEL